MGVWWDDSAGGGSFGFSSGVSAAAEPVVPHAASTSIGDSSGIAPKPAEPEVPLGFGALLALTFDPLALDAAGASDVALCELVPLVLSACRRSNSFSSLSASSTCDDLLILILGLVLLRSASLTVLDSHDGCFSIISFVSKCRGKEAKA